MPGLSYEAMAARTGFSIRWCIELVSRPGAETPAESAQDPPQLRPLCHQCLRCGVSVAAGFDLQEALERRQAYVQSKADTARLRSSERSLHRNPNTEDKIPPCPLTATHRSRCHPAGKGPKLTVRQAPPGAPGGLTGKKKGEYRCLMPARRQLRSGK